MYYRTLSHCWNPDSLSGFRDYLFPRCCSRSMRISNVVSVSMLLGIDSAIVSLVTPSYYIRYVDGDDFGGLEVDWYMNSGVARRFDGHGTKYFNVSGI